MRTIAHLSDLHFGRVDPLLIEPCLRAVVDAGPDLVVVSGDLTQRARSHQFAEAREFLEKLPKPLIVIPGNHDVPLHNVYGRIAAPFAKYRRLISDDLEPTYVDGEIAVTSINTAHAMTLRGGGRIARASVLRACERLKSWGDGLLKVVVTHHPFDLPPLVKEHQLVRGAESAMAALAECGADLFLAGHLHVVHTELTTRRYKIPGWTGLIVQASTGLSTRRRMGEANAFNVLRSSAQDIRIETVGWDGEKFSALKTQRFCRKQRGWERAA